MVLLIGVGLAWPFHLSGDAPPETPAVDSPPVDLDLPAAEPERLQGPIDLTQLPYGSDAPLTAASIANISASPATSPPAVEPSIASPPRPALPPEPPHLPSNYPAAENHASTETTPVFAPLRPVIPESPAPTARIHVVHNGDTLGRLAHRYLGSEDRALEIFDLNREVLDNPHLLPIGAELKIPPPQ